MFGGQRCHPSYSKHDTAECWIKQLLRGLRCSLMGIVANLADGWLRTTVLTFDQPADRDAPMVGTDPLGKMHQST